MLELLNQASISTILVKGNPGTGKSSLVLELLRVQGRGTYVSTRVSKENLAMHNQQVSLVVVAGAEKDMRIADTSLDVKDYRLAGAEQVVRLVMREIGDKPGGLIVLDSWDAIAKLLTPIERLQAEKTMVAAIQASDSKLVFVSEEPTMTTTDFLVDAIVELSLELKNGQIRRWVETVKIRGQEIARARRLFTLKDGKFKILDSLDVKFPGDYEPKPYVRTHHEDGKYHSGVKGLDKELSGGFVPGSVVCLDYGTGVAPYSLLPFDLRIHSNFISQGGCVLLVPNAGISPMQVVKPLRSILPLEDVESRLRVGFFDKYPDPCTFTLDDSSAEATFDAIRKEIEELKGQSSRPCFIQLGIDNLEYVLGKREVLKHLTLEMSRARAQGDLFLTSVGDSTECKAVISSISDYHIVFENNGNVLTFQSIIPASSIFAIGYDYSLGYPRVSFDRIS